MRQGNLRPWLPHESYDFSVSKTGLCAAELAEQLLPQERERNEAGAAEN